MRDREAAIARIARQQHSVFSGAQAKEAGYPRRTIYDLVQRGEWVRVVGDSYRVAATAETWQQPIVGGWLAVGEPAAIAGGSALAMWQLAEAGASLPEVAVPWTKRVQVSGVRITRTRRWTTTDVVAMGALRVTSVVRTLLDLSPTMPERDLEIAIDAAHRRRLLHAGRVGAYLRRAVEAKIPGASKLARLVALRDDGRPLESAAETLFLRLIRRAGLPRPVPQYWVTTRRGRRRVDFAYPERRLAIEIDGYTWHDGGRIELDEDRARRNELRDAGWDLRHFTWTTVTEQPRDTVWTVAGALGLEPKGWRSFHR